MLSSGAGEGRAHKAGLKFLLVGGGTPDFGRTVKL